MSVWIDGNRQIFHVPVPPAGADRASTPEEGATSGSIDAMLRWQSETWSQWLELFEAVRPRDIEAVEIFRGVAQIPAEFLDDSCAAVVIWTREGGRS